MSPSFHSLDIARYSPPLDVYVLLPAFTVISLSSHDGARRLIFALPVPDTLIFTLSEYGYVVSTVNVRPFSSHSYVRHIKIYI